MKPTLSPLITGCSQKAAQYYGHQSASQADLDAFYVMMTSPCLERAELVPLYEVTDVSNSQASIFRV